MLQSKNSEPKPPNTQGKDRLPKKRTSSQRNIPPSSVSPRKATKTSSERDQNGSVYSFFNPRTQLQISHKQGQRRIPSAPEEGQNQDEDLIEDDPDVRDDSTLSQTSASNHRQEGTKHLELYASRDGSKQESVPAALRFASSLQASQVRRVSERRFTGLERQPWTDRYAPQDLDELAVHKKKVTDVEAWLSNAISGRSQKRLLVLRGPSGSGKTTTVQLLAQHLGISISKWSSLDSTSASETPASTSASLQDFLTRSQQYVSLDLNPSYQLGEPSAGVTNTASIVLLEGFPPTLVKGSQALRSFQTSILQHLASSSTLSEYYFNRSNSTGSTIPVLVMIISEVRSGDFGSSSRNFTAHHLLGHKILEHSSAAVMDFNPIASTLLVKALEAVLQKEARDSGRRRIPGPEVLKTISEVGDVRSAIGALEFLCLRGDHGSDWSGTVAGLKKKGARTRSSATRSEIASVKFITQRESYLELFHAVGKIVYNKRSNELGRSDRGRVVQPPPHHADKVRESPSLVSPDSLLDECGTDLSTLLAALHENYVLSCDGPTFVDTLDQSINALSDADNLLTRAGTTLSRSSLYQTSSEELRSVESALQLASRGILFALPLNVRRQSVNLGLEKVDAYKMYWPVSAKLWRSIDDTSVRLDKWSNALRSFHKVQSIRRNGVREYGADILSSSPADTRVMALEMLPYFAKIARHLSAAELADLRKLTSFTGFVMHGTATDDDDGESGDVEASQAGKIGVGRAHPPSPFTSNTHKLVLSDDDIEDDG